MLLTALFPISKFMPSHSFLVVTIAVKDTRSVSFLKLGPFISTGLTNDFLLFDSFIVFVLSSKGVHPTTTYSLRASASFTDRL